MKIWEKVFEFISGIFCSLFAFWVMIYESYILILKSAGKQHQFPVWFNAIRQDNIIQFQSHDSYCISEHMFFCCFGSDWIKVHSNTCKSISLYGTYCTHVKPCPQWMSFVSVQLYDQKFQSRRTQKWYRFCFQNCEYRFLFHVDPEVLSQKRVQSLSA